MITKFFLGSRWVWSLLSNGSDLCRKSRASNGFLRRWTNQILPRRQFRSCWWYINSHPLTVKLRMRTHAVLIIWSEKLPPYFTKVCPFAASLLVLLTFFDSTKFHTRNVNAIWSAWGIDKRSPFQLLKLTFWKWKDSEILNSSHYLNTGTKARNSSRVSFNCPIANSSFTKSPTLLYLWSPQYCMSKQLISTFDRHCL